jgi:hypothetical protein
VAASAVSAGLGNLNMMSSLMMQNLWVLSSRANELIQVAPSWAGRVKLRGGPPG